MVDGVVNDWLRFFQDQWYDFSRLTILSFHSINGDVNKDTTMAANSNILLLVQDCECCQLLMAEHQVHLGAAHNQLCLSHQCPKSSWANNTLDRILY
jgi:hypothetical protein